MKKPPEAFSQPKIADRPKRKDFCVIESKNYSQEKREIAKGIEDALGFYEETYEGSSLVEMDPGALEKAIGIMSEAVAETADILDIDVPDIPAFAFYADPTVTERKIDEDKTVREMVWGELVTAGPERRKIKINIHFLRICVQKIADSPHRGTIKADEYLRSFIAEEMYHEYTIRRFPATAARTSEANVADGEAYDKDRGENAAKLFANGYVKAKTTLREKAPGNAHPASKRTYF